MFGEKLYGEGILKGMWVTLKHFFATYVDDIKYGLNKYAERDNFEFRQGPKSEGAFTVQYPDEKIAVPERFRFVPFLVVEDYDHEERPGHPWCTSCGICAKVCPPQCIWIVRSTDPATGRPKPEPEAFYIDIDICMNCGFCAEFCPFDAIKMDHDYELASYDRTTNHIYDLPKLAKEFKYWKSIAPTTAIEEAEARGGWEHPDVIKEKEKAAKAAAKAAAATAPAPATTPAQPKDAASTAIPTGAQAAQGESIKTDTPDAAAETMATARANQTSDTAAPAEPVDEEAAKAERLAKREAALARKRAAKQQGNE